MSGQSPSDVAHNPQTYFAEAHRALIALDPSLLTLQLHGFSDDRAPGTDVVVSASDTKGPAEAVAEALAAGFSEFHVKLYPAQIRDLGGTKNAQAAACRDVGASFVHLEMSGKLRTALTTRPELLEKFVAALDNATKSSRAP